MGSQSEQLKQVLQKLALHKKYLVVLGVFVVAIVGAVLLPQIFNNRQETRIQAGSSKVTLALAPSTGTIKVGETKTYILTATFTGGSATEKLDYFKTEITFPKQYIEAASEDFIDTGISGFTEILREETGTIANGNGRLIIELASPTPNSGPATNQAITIAEIRFKGSTLVNNANTIAIDNTKTQIVNNESVAIPLNTPQNTTFTVIAGPTATQTPPGNRTWNITAKAVCANGTPITNQNYLTRSYWYKNPSGTDAYSDWSFGNKTITITDSTTNDYFVQLMGRLSSQPASTFISLSPKTFPENTSPLTATYITWKGANLAGGNYTFEYLAPDLACSPTDPTVTPSATPPIPTVTPIPTPTINPNWIKIGTIFFKAKPVDGLALIQFKDNPQSIAVEKDTAQDLLGTTQNLEIAIGDISNIHGIIIKGKLRSVAKNIGNQRITVRIKQDSQVSEYKDIPVTFDDQGIFTSSTIQLSGITPGSGYEVFVKGPKHLAKKFENITFNTGQQTLDFTQTVLEPGDTIPQDGVINATDISRILELLGRPDITEENLTTADLNYDGVINGADINELVVTLSTKYDED